MTTPHLPDSPTTTSRALRAERRAKALAYLKRGFTISETARKLNLSTGTVHYWVANPHLHEPDGDARYTLDWEALRREVKRTPGASLKELGRRLGVSHHAVWRALREMGIRRQPARRRAASADGPRQDAN
jgi:transposase